MEIEGFVVEKLYCFDGCPSIRFWTAREGDILQGNPEIAQITFWRGTVSILQIAEDHAKSTT